MSLKIIFFCIKKTQSTCYTSSDPNNKYSNDLEGCYALCVNCITLSRRSFFFARVSKKDSTKTKQEELFTFRRLYQCPVSKTPMNGQSGHNNS